MWGTFNELGRHTTVEEVWGKSQSQILESIYYAEGVWGTFNELGRHTILRRCGENLNHKSWKTYTMLRGCEELSMNSEGILPLRRCGENLNHKSWKAYTMLRGCGELSMDSEGILPLRRWKILIINLGKHILG